MPTYHEVMCTNLSTLTAAADKWEETATKFKTLEDRYETGVHGVSLGESWIGLSANAAHARLTVTLRELQGAQQEAMAVARILREAHTQLTDLRNRIEVIRDGAVKAGMSVSDQGAVAFDTARLTPSERTAFAHDRDYQESARAQASEWAQKLAQAAKAITDADSGIRLALDAAVLDSDPMDGTFNGFNRNPEKGPYPSLEEAGKAAGMPKDRKDVPAWWHSLDPVTRGILLREKGDELRAAGIMDPRYDWRSPDPGSGGFDTEDPTPQDLLFHARALAIATAGDLVGENAASRNMLHYLRGTGEPLDLDVDRILNDDPTFKAQIETNHVTGYQEAWRREALDAFAKAGGDKTIAIPVESDHDGKSFQADEWFHAVGAHEQNISGLVTVTPGAGGKPEVSLDYRVNVWDRYNWDQGKSTSFPGGVTIPDDEMGRLHKVGFAQEFDMRGSSSTFHHDMTSAAPPSVHPADPGRDGGRGDVSRGDEKNR
ncbi:hypothetical protein [Streptomyces sp. NPDC050600]|uniref:hypothetical protein n=1 Tax=Streptomyces sp. NPDC050600 TaxID=3157213 RepID=UPI003418596A